MPRRNLSLPKYRKHKDRGLAFVELNGRRFYLGPYGTRASKREYDRIVGEWQQNGRRLPSGEDNSLSIAELLNSYLKYSKGYYRKDGRPTGTTENIKPMLKLVRQYYGDSLVVDFGPLALKALQSRMIEADNSRTYINDQTKRIRRMFKWAASNELIPFEVYQRLTTVDGLRKGRSEARETPQINPVKDAVVDATILHLPTVVADMVRFQRLTGCRPAEVCCIRPCDIDTSGDVWLYQPESHKAEHHDRARIIVVGPKAQNVLRPYLLRDNETHCFSPADSERRRLQDRHDQRTTLVHYGNSPGTNRKRKPKRSAGDHYTTDSFRRAIHRACDKAFPPQYQLKAEELKAWRKEHRWSPNQLRHATGTEIRRRFGLEGAQVVLGHAQADVTQVYAERDLQKAVQIMREVG